MQCVKASKFSELSVQYGISYITVVASSERKTRASGQMDICTDILEKFIVMF